MTESGEPTVTEQPPTLLARLFGPASVGRYALIGLSGVTLDTVLYILLTPSAMAPVPATVLSTTAGILNNYVLNAKLNFGTPLSVVHGRRFLLVGLIGLVVAAFSLQALLELGVDPVAAKILSVPVVVVSQFVANKRWSFGD
jgi:putative flippase GtrA